MIDLHIHTNYSGGQSNLKEVLQIAQRRKVSFYFNFTPYTATVEKPLSA